jgi:hypothetical protein
LLEINGPARPVEASWPVKALDSVRESNPRGCLKGRARDHVRQFLDNCHTVATNSGVLPRHFKLSRTESLEASMLDPTLFGLLLQVERDEIVLPAMQRPVCLER